MVSEEEMDKRMRKIAFLRKEETNEDRAVAADRLDELGLDLVAAYARLEGWAGARARHGIWFLIENTDWWSDWSNEEVPGFDGVKQFVDSVHATSEREPKIPSGLGRLNDRAASRDSFEGS